MGNTVRTWLASLDLAHLESLFEEHQIDLRDLPLLSNDDLKELGIPLGPRRRILNAIAPNKASQVPTVASTVPLAEAERRQLTVMFIDLVGSTALSARLDPEDMRDVIRGFQDACAGVITRYDGHVAEYMGDGILAYFGWPRAHEDEAERAGRAGLEVVNTIANLQTRAGVALQVRVGIATGLVVVGDLISESGARKNSATGATPNLASRLQTLAEPGTVVIAAVTAQLIGKALQMRSLGPQLLKGLPGSAEVFRITGEPESVSRFEARFGQADLPMVGRETDLALLLECWKLSRDGKGQAVLLSGEAGIGKSRISKALTDIVAPKEGTVLRLQCSPYHTDSALWPVIQYLRHAAGLLRGEPTRTQREKVQALVEAAGLRHEGAESLLASLIGLEAPTEAPGISPAVRRKRTMEVLKAQLLNLASQKPVLMLIEDIHWIDPTTHELITLWLEEIAAANVLLVVTSRPEPQPKLDAYPHLTHMELSRLRPDAGRSMVASLAGNGLPPETVEAIITRTDGVPLFVEELTKAIMETGEASIPASLQDTLMARLDQFHDVKEIAQTAAAIGREFSLRLLRAVSTKSEAELQSSLGKLAAAEIIFPFGDVDDPQFSFKHALVLDAAYQSLLKSRRQSLHSRIFETLKTAFPEMAEHQPELLAHHAAEAHMPQLSALYGRYAAEQAMKKSANLEAIGHYTRALAQLALCPATVERTSEELDLQLGLGVASILPKSHGSDDVRRAFTRAEALSAELGDTPRHFRALRGLWHWHSVSADFQEAALLAGQLANLANHSGEPARRLMAHRIMGYTQMTLGAYEGARKDFNTALALYQPDEQSEYVRTHGEDPGLWCYAYLSWVEDWLGNRDQALEWSEKGVALARDLPNRYSRSFSLGLAAYLHRWRGDPAATLSAAEEAGESAREQGVAQFGAWADVLGGWAVAASGDIGAGLRQAESGFATWCALGLIHVQWRHQILLADIHRMAGDYELALARISEAEKRINPASIGLGIADFHLMKGTLLVDAGEVQAGEQSLLYAMKLAQDQKATLFELRAATGLARLWGKRNRHDAAAALLSPFQTRIKEGKNTSDYQAAETVLLQLAC